MSEVFSAARATDPIGHGYGMLGMLAGAALGVALIVGGVLTGGALFLVAAVAVAALSGAALANGIQKVTGTGNPWTGNLGFGSPNVKINGLGAARVMLDFATPICNGLYGTNHFPLLPIPPIAEGNPTIKINGMPAARVKHELVCSADITKGSPNVYYGAATEQVLPIINTEKILSLIGTGILVAAFGIEAAIVGYVVTSVIGDLADTYLGEGWGDIINGTLGFLALGLGAVASRRGVVPERVSVPESGKVEYPGFGGDIITDPAKTTTVIGKFNDEVNGAGTKEILNMPDGSFTRGGENKGGVNILDIPSERYQALLDEHGDVRGKEIFWEEYNQPFLEDAFARGDNVRVLSDPEVPKNRSGFYDRELREIEGYTDARGNYVPGLAEKYGYVFDPVTHTYIKR